MDAIEFRATVETNRMSDNSLVERLRIINPLFN
jgi:hypothetical protein